MAGSATVDQAETVTKGKNEETGLRLGQLCFHGPYSWAVRLAYTSLPVWVCMLMYFATYVYHSYKSGCLILDELLIDLNQNLLMTDNVMSVLE